MLPGSAQTVSVPSCPAYAAVLATSNVAAKAANRVSVRDLVFMLASIKG